jgi:hypothetical protein
LEFTVAGPETPIAYAKWVYLAANVDLLSDIDDQEQVRDLAERQLNGETIEWKSEESLSTDARRIVAVFSAKSSGEFRSRLNDAPQNFQQRLAALSPSHYIDGLRAPLILVHAAHDPSVPAQQSIELAEAARTRGIESRLTLLQMYGHTYPVLPKLGFASIAGFYVPEAVRFLRVINNVVAIR